MCLYLNGKKGLLRTDTRLAHKLFCPRESHYIRASLVRVGGGQWKGGLVGLPFGVRSGFVRGAFGVRSGQFRSKISGAKILKFQKFSICAAVAAPLAAIPSPAARKAPAAAATAAQIDIFCDKGSEKSRKSCEQDVF